MKKVIFVLIMLCLIILPKDSFAIILNFDDISLPPPTPERNTFQPMPINYGGLSWDTGKPDYWGENQGQWFVWDDALYATPHSPSNYVFNGFGGINLGFDVVSYSPLTNIGAWFVNTQALNPSQVRFIGYVSGSPTYYSSWLNLSYDPQYLSVNFIDGNVTRVVVEMNGNGWFAMDDLEFTPIPEPSSLLLLGFGLLGAGAYKRKRTR